MAFALINLGYSDGVNKARPRFPNDSEYMEGYDLGLSDRMDPEPLTPGRKFSEKGKEYQELDLPL